MTLKQWLKLHRQPTYSGTNARMTLKDRGARFWRYRALSPMLFHIAISAEPTLKHALMRNHLAGARRARLSLPH